MALPTIPSRTLLPAVAVAAVPAPTDGGRHDLIAVAGWRVELAGQDLTEALRPRLAEMTLTEKRGEEADELELVLHDSDGAIILPPPQAIIAVAMGWVRGSFAAGGAFPAGGPTLGLISKGRFRVDELAWDGPPDMLRITARSADLTDTLRVRRDRSWVGQTLGAIIERIAAAHGLTPRVHARLAGISVPAAAQSATSDMAFVARLGRRYDAVATVRDGNLIFTPIGTAATVSGRALPGRTLTRALVARHAWTRKKRDEHDGAEAQYHDSGGARRRTVRSGGGTAAGGAGGAAVSATGTPRRLRRTYASEGEAREAASAAARRDARQAAEIDIDLVWADVSYGVETPITLSGFKAEIDAARWRVAEISHRLGDQGFSTSMKLDLGGE